MPQNTLNLINLPTSLNKSTQVAVWECSQAAAIVHILHGMGEHKARYHDFATFLTQNNIQVYAHDHFGHGSAISESTPKGHFGDAQGFKNVLSVVDDVHKHIHQKHPNMPVFLLGHSMGSFIAQHYLIDYPCRIKGLILSGSASTPRPLLHALSLVAKVESLRLGKHSYSKLIDFLSFGSYNKEFKPNRTQFDWLSRDPEQVDKYMADELCGFICSSDSWQQLAQSLLHISDKSALQKIPAELPTLIISGDRDPVGGFGKYLKNLQQLWIDTGHNKVELQLLPDARHEVLNEINKETTYTALLQWINNTM